MPVIGHVHTTQIELDYICVGNYKMRNDSVIAHLHKAFR